MKKKIIFFDIYNVICKTKLGDYKNSRPIIRNIKTVNYLYDSGYIVKIYTARFMGRTKDNLYQAKKLGYKFTIKQLTKWKVKYHKLYFGKPSFDLTIDDKSIFYKEDWYKNINNILKKLIR